MRRHVVPIGARALIAAGLVMSIVGAAAAQSSASAPRQHRPAARAKAKPASGARVALLVGISDYPGEDQDLGGGPLNDVALTKDLLVKRLGFTPENVVTLVDHQATRANIIATFRAHLAKAGPSGVAVFYFSGHGTQLPNDNATEDAEDDGLDEVIVVRGSKPESISALRDDELGYLADELPTSRVLFILDNCYSGTGTRGAGRSLHWSAFAGDTVVPAVLRSKPVGSSRGSMAKRLPAESMAKMTREPFQPIATSRSMEPSRHLLLSASAEDELSVNVPLVLEDGTQAAVGLLTGALYSSLYRSNLQQLTFEQLVDSLRDTARGVVARLRTGPQTPQIEGANKGAAIGAFLGAK